MKIVARVSFCVAAILVCLPAMAQAQLTGKVTHEVGGSVGHLPQTRPLAGATIIIGAGIDIEVGQTGTDKVRGRVAAKVISGSDGTFTLNVPAGTYDVICWKQGYVPQREGRIKVPGTLPLSLGADSSGRGLHREITYAAR